MISYTFGYFGRTVLELMDIVARDNIALVVDVRRKPRSRWSQWNRQHLRSVLGDHYRWMKALGNGTKSARAVPLVDEERGLAELVRMLRRYESVLLLCVEEDPGRCHRSYIAEKVAQTVHDVEVIHLRPP